MTVMSFKNEEGKGILNVIHYSCHGTSAGAALEITRDWPGHMVDRLEELSGAKTVFFNGNCGDMGPRLSNGATTGLTNTLSQMNEISALAAIDAVRIFRQIKNYEEVDFEILKGTVVRPYKKMPSLEEVKASIENMGDPEKLDCLEIPTYSTLKKIEKLYEDNVEFKTEMKIPQALFTFNKVAFVPIPFEVFSPINLRIRLFSPFEYTLCTGITNGSNSKPVLRLLGGKYYLGYNHSDNDMPTQKRDKFTILTSSDCENWTEFAEIHAETTFQYPTLEFYNGKIYFSASVGDKEQIIFGEII
jgi:hypothetical protein